MSLIRSYTRVITFLSLNTNDDATSFFVLCVRFHAKSNKSIKHNTFCLLRFNTLKYYMYYNSARLRIYIKIIHFPWSSVSNACTVHRDCITCDFRLATPSIADAKFVVRRLHSTRFLRFGVCYHCVKDDLSWTILDVFVRGHLFSIA